MAGTNQKKKLLCLLQILRERTDENHIMSATDLGKALGEYGISAERKSIYADVETLIDFGIDIVQKKGTNPGYYIGSREFEIAELKLLVDAAQASKFITQEKANTICAKIKRNMADSHTQPSLNRKAYVAERIHSMNDSVVKEADRLHEAIENNKQIQFKYFHYSPDKSKKRTYAKSGDIYVVNPFSLYWDNGNYYLYAHDGKKFRYYRVDRMEKIELRAEDREFVEEYKDENIRHRKAKIFQMYGGKEYTVKMRFRNGLADQVIDQFGADITMIPTDSEHFTVKVPVQVSPTFYAWVSTFGRSVKILEPENVVDGMRNFLQKSLDMYKDDGEM